MVWTVVVALLVWAMVLVWRFGMQTLRTMGIQALIIGAMVDVADSWFPTVGLWVPLHVLTFLIFAILGWPGFFMIILISLCVYQ